MVPSVDPSGSSVYVFCTHLPASGESRQLHANNDRTKDGCTFPTWPSCLLMASVTCVNNTDSMCFTCFAYGWQTNLPSRWAEGNKHAHGLLIHMHRCRQALSATPSRASAPPTVQQSDITPVQHTRISIASEQTYVLHHNTLTRT
jgi:hypothetical protein